MDKNAARDLLLTGFKPREKDIATPYLGELDGELKLVSLSGMQAIEIRQMAMVQTIDAEGKATTKLDSAKFLGLLIIRCLYHRASNEPLLSQLIPSNGDAADLQALLEMDDRPFEELGSAVNEFLGIGSKAVTDAKKNSNQTPKNDGGSPLPESSEDVPLTNSNDASTTESSSNG